MRLQVTFSEKNPEDNFEMNRLSDELNVHDEDDEDSLNIIHVLE